MKSRFTALDLRAVVNELKSQIEGMRLQNIYDVSPVGRAFLLKFSKTDQKVSIVLESGSRIHATSFTVEKPNILPSGFAAKLRKHLRGRRISSIEQVAFDRVVHFCFGSDFESQQSRQEHEFHLYLELFAQGNVILTDWEGKIITILRPVDVESTGKLAVGEFYNPFPEALNLKLLTETDFPADGITIDLKSLSRSILAAFSPQMIDFCGKKCEITAGKLPRAKLETFIKFANELIEAILRGDRYIGLLQVQEELSSKEQLLDPKCPAVLHSFHPLEEFSILGNSLYSLKYESFNEAVDIYFSRLDAEKSSQKQVNSELEAERKLAAIEAEQKGRISGLEAAVEVYRLKGQLVTEHAEDVESALKVARSAIESGMDWTEFGRLIESEKKSSNAKRAAVATLYAGLKLVNGQISLKLGEGETGMVVDLLVGLSAHANAKRLYDLRTQARLKMERTMAAHESAMKSASTKIRSEMSQSRQLGRVKQLQALRKPFWFEKFAWFISSDGFLVLAGRDAQQNEHLVKKYLKAGDVYVHADVHGAGSLIIKNHVYPELKTPPPKTLHEAGTFSICFSRAWEAKILTSAWWVRAEQVSKTAPSGEYLGTGSFMIRGQKNFLPPMQLSLSFGFVFGVDEEERKARQLERKKRESSGNWGGEDGNEINYEKYRITTTTNESPEINSIVNTAYETTTSSSSSSKTSKLNKTQKSLKQLQVTEPETITEKKTESGSSVRGKHGKEKKIKKKYADQDDEERELRMKLLGNFKHLQQQGEVQVKKRAINEAKSGLDAEPAVKSKEKKPVSLSVDLVGDVDDSSVGDDEFIATDCLEMFPKEESNYTFALPVCFPTSAFSSARFRLKLVPGNLKKGKAVKSALSLLTNQSTCPIQSWRDMMRSVPETEMITVMPAKVALGVSVHETNKLKKAKPQKKPKN